MKTLNISKEIKLPLDAVTQSIGILAKRRAGKSFCAKVFVEELYSAMQQVCIIDPKGDWWGMRYASDGKSPGLPIFIIGGERGDIPLEVNGGSIVAKLLVEERVSVLLDLSLFRKHEVATFMTTFLEDLYRLKAQEKYRTPLMLMVDEADAIAPQKPQMNETRMLGAIEDIVRRGGQRGIGCTMVTQRSAVLNKNVLTQIQMLICLRTIAPQDLAAMDEWIQVHGEREQRKILMDSLPSLPVGDAWFWSPGWPTDAGIFQRSHVRPIYTFDSGATPKPGEKRITPKNLAHVDIEVLRRQMAETVERAKENDPSELKKRIKELEKQVSAKRPAAVEPKIKEINVVNPKLVTRLEKIHASVTKEAERHGKAMAIFWNNLDEVNTAMIEALKSVTKPQPIPIPQVGVRTAETFPAAAAQNRSQGLRKTETSKNTSALGKCERTLISVLATRKGVATSKSQLSILSGYSLRSSGLQNALSRLRTTGLATGGDKIFITAEGELAAGEVQPLPTGEALQQYWKNSLGKAEATILDVLIRQWPNAVDKQSISEASGYSLSSSGFQNALSKLRTLELASGSSELVASSFLFE